MTTHENVLKILHLNDLHSHFENYPKIKRFFTDHADGFSDVLRFDLGDNVDRSHPLSEATLGRANVSLMNDLALTAATIGNNEGLGLQKHMLDQLYDEANFDVVLANLKDATGAEPVQPAWAIEKKQVITSFGMTIDIFGLTARYPLAYPHMGWDILDPESVLAAQLSASEADFTILLSHLGWRFDEAAAARFDNLDLILGAHTHHVYEYGKYINGTILAAAGRYGEHVGEVTLVFDDAFQVVQSDVLAENTRNLAIKPGDKSFAKSLVAQGHALLRQNKITTLATGISNDFPDHLATQFVADIFSDFYAVPAVIMNSGMIVRDLPRDLTMDDLHEILPHSIRLVKFTVTGLELRKIMLEIYDVGSYLRTQRVIGMGFRGKVFGDIVTRGVAVRDGQIYYQDHLISDEKSYQILVPDQYYFASYFPILKSSGTAEIQFPRFMREIVAESLKAEK
ncbi:bifunctional metallophosphatase/5'-nucleotidase [Lactococcus insecticola]|uniref:Multifunctional 2',3'-cyclic-nucleotide 2'-phosphodiesterase/5'-nucleotidase/3'-nucleotidase n=1 Tax=Pseudolactococcus insecticola TaxID=2709158 RepID=A0A6A0B6Y2_9LACT|nr:bifunctional UDP-sugar hydrolase/5'-nucleotidase [Lactococcus insecticola]GFH41110.1 multifunctional 2',3'-cyclic-nucleotide 2'-phosphodiesterase/5'-nucleotidase/3'-nucleotidase [Lactococcus insecticola]